MMKKKWIAAGIAAAIIAVVLGASWWLSRGEGTTGAKEVEIIVVDRSGAQEEEVLRTSVHTDAQTLTQLLEEQEELQAESEQSTYGSLLTSIGGLDQDMENGPWLVFESENNPSCKDAGGMCPAMDEVRIADGDRFTFALIAGF